MFHRRTLLASALASSLPWPAWAQSSTGSSGKNSLTLGMALEPPMLDPTVSAAASGR